MTTSATLERVTVNVKHLAAALHLAPSADIRYYLNGVCVQGQGNQLRTIATDGKVIGCLRCERPSDDIGDGELIIPLEAVKALVKAVPKSLDFVTLTKLPAREGDAVDVVRWTQEFFNVIFPAVVGKFPDWKRVIPAAISGEPAQYKPEDMEHFVKARKALGGKGSIYTHHNGSSVAAVSILGCPEFVGAVMPLKAIDAPCITRMAFDEVGA